MSGHLGDRAVMVTALIAGAFLFGMDVGHWRARDQIARTCPPQQGESLVATHQRQDGTVWCEYSRAFGLASRRKKAT